MTLISEIFRTHGPEYIERYGDSMPGNQKKALDAIINCRSAASGVAFYSCDNCDEIHPVFRSCGNRHCPLCQSITRPAYGLRNSSKSNCLDIIS